MGLFSSKEKPLLAALLGSVQFSCSVMSDSLRPHELKHTRPPCPSPTPGVHSNSRPHGLQPTRLLHPWDFPGKSTGVGCHCLLRLQILNLLKVTCLSMSLQSNYMSNMVSFVYLLLVFFLFFAFCYFFLVSSLQFDLVTQSCLTDSLRPHRLQPTRLLHPWQRS